MKHDKLAYLATLAHEAKKNQERKQLFTEGAKLIDDLCSAYRIILLPDDQKVRDEMAKEGKK